MSGRHGGDIYRNDVKLDFSVNINPLGMPETVKKALHEAVVACEAYPDDEAAELRSAVSAWQGVPAENLLFGNGASELLMAAFQGIKPRRPWILAPSFYGYERAALASGGNPYFYKLKEENNFLPGEDFVEKMTDDADFLVLANPNNPTGRLLGREYLISLLEACREKHIPVLLDECFIEFCGGEFSLLPELERFPNLLILRAFTKIFAIPGVRLGYLLGSDAAFLKKVERQLPEWNLSAFAQAAGIACAGERDYLIKTREFVKKERIFLEENLKKTGVKVFPGEAGFILIYSEKPLYEKLLEQGILIRDCGNFRGLGKGYYRIAVKGREENEKILRAIGGI